MPTLRVWLIGLAVCAAGFLGYAHLHARAMQRAAMYNARLFLVRAYADYERSGTLPPSPNESALLDAVFGRGVEGVAAVFTKDEEAADDCEAGFDELGADGIGLPGQSTEGPLAGVADRVAEAGATFVGAAAGNALRGVVGEHDVQVPLRLRA